MMTIDRKRLQQFLDRVGNALRETADLEAGVGREELLELATEADDLLEAVESNADLGDFEA